VLIAVLAETGGCVLLPEAVDVAPGDSDEEVRFIDAEGRTLAVFQRSDLAIYSRRDQLPNEFFGDGASPQPQTGR
jgi:hypothetical protein